MVCVGQFRLPIKSAQAPTALLIWSMPFSRIAGSCGLTRNPMFLIYPMMMVMAMVGMLTGGMGGRSGKAAPPLSALDGLYDASRFGQRIFPWLCA